MSRSTRYAALKTLEAMRDEGSQQAGRLLEAVSDAYTLSEVIEAADRWRAREGARTFDAKTAARMERTRGNHVAVVRTAKDSLAAVDLRTLAR